MLETITVIRALLNRQLEALQDGMQAMTKTEWMEYYSREEQIASLMASLPCRTQQVSLSPTR